MLDETIRECMLRVEDSDHLVSFNCKRYETLMEKIRVPSAEYQGLVQAADKPDGSK
jgi:hypothetical protein